MAIDQQAAPGWRNIKCAPFATPLPAWQRSPAAPRPWSNLIEQGAELTWQMDGDQDRGWEVVRESLRQQEQRFDPARGRADGHDVSVGHAAPSGNARPLA